MFGRNLVTWSLLVCYIASLVQSWSPTDSYAPGSVDCPSDKDLVRIADSISDEEKSWLEGRDSITRDKLSQFLNHANMTDIDVDAYAKGNRSIHIGLAFSGGGYRAMLNGAGQLSALDSRTRNNDFNEQNSSISGLGGLLDATTYIAGLSGGSWLVGSIVMNNFTSVQQIVDQNKIWDLTRSIFNYGKFNIKKSYKYYKGISDDIEAKRKAGFELTLTDTWGRALSHQFFTTLDDYGASMTFSSLQDWPIFTEHNMPFPIILSDARAPNTKIISLNSSLNEFNAFEMGSWDPSIYQFTQIKYLGTQVRDGETNGSCIGGFDNAGFIMGSSSTLFNAIIFQVNTTTIPKALKTIITSILQDVSKHEDDVAMYKPNPFYDTTAGFSTNIAQNDSYTLVDGGEDGENIPLYPLFQPARDVDVVFAFDNSADTPQNWPNGSSLVESYNRQFGVEGNNTIFPYVPDTNTFVNKNLTAKPTFFGCNAKNLTSLARNNKTDVYDVPLLVYIANRPFSYFTNTSTEKMKYDNKERNSIITNGFEVASRYNLTLDPEWPACVGCAIIRRTQERNGEEQSEQCKQCFERYCWDGSLDTSDADDKMFYTDQGTTSEQEGLKKTNSGNKATLNWSLWFGLLAMSLVFFR
ncbi:hypothetical protein KGF56_000199 [Candida oxycetoniae]|uniref:Lysophospholipase n=1 Tax=Candida oxycetoniae TaxID=497107 RepID=A0AAI9X002_9ASCO|nr:uncharacterized protein KGF56_000199 [Candida oxycetoniae]KAI3406907.2 hypothetical protein KGF56_000199 [Candida oxycetoniae]